MTLIEYSLCRLLIYSVFPLRAKPPASRFKNISQHEDDATPDTRSEKKMMKTMKRLCNETEHYHGQKVTNLLSKCAAIES